MPDKKKINCKLNTCVNIEKKSDCSLDCLPFSKNLIPSSIKCPYFDDDSEKSIEEYKRKGGTLGAIARMYGRKTESELKQEKKSKRKPREDKGKKRKKEENSLEDMFE